MGCFEKKFETIFLHLMKVELPLTKVAIETKKPGQPKIIFYVTKKKERVDILHNSYYRNPTKEKLVLPTLRD